MRVFISQPMRDKTVDEIAETRARAIDSVKAHFPDEEIEIIDNWLTGNENPLYKLGMSLQLLSTADVAYFAYGYEEYRGCRIENECAIEYGVGTVIEDYKNYKIRTREI